MGLPVVLLHIMLQVRDRLVAIVGTIETTIVGTIETIITMIGIEITTGAIGVITMPLETGDIVVGDFKVTTKHTVILFVCL